MARTRPNRGVPIALLLMGTACTARGDDPEGSAVVGIEMRDSAGIGIVENHGPPVDHWTLSATPLIEISQDLPVEQVALDPTAVFAGPDGRVVVGDGNQVGWHAILVYDERGALSMKLGGAGQGPGEFGGQLWWAGPYRGDSIVAWDRRGPSMKIFGPDGTFARDVSIPPLPRTVPEGTLPYSAGFHGAFEDGALLTSSRGVLRVPDAPGPSRYRHLLLAVEPAGTASDTIGEVALDGAYWDGRAQSRYLFGSMTLVRAYGNEVLIAPSSAYEYQVLDRTGMPRLIVRKDHVPVPVTPQDIRDLGTSYERGMASMGAVSEAQLNEMRRRLEDSPRAPTKPAYSSLFADDAGRVWVERFRWLDAWSMAPDPEPTMWDVFDREGRWIAEVLVPASVLILSVTGDRAFGVRVDEMDVKHVVVHAIER